MFRRKEQTMDPDPAFPADLKALGFFVNDLGQIRLINAPDKEFVFQATNNERVNEVRREAFQECMRTETEKRLAALGLHKIYFPGLTNTKPDGPHVPILAPSLELLKTRKRIIVLVNDATQDLGILSYGQMQRELGLGGASVVDLAKKLISRSTTSEKHAGLFGDGCGVEDQDEVPAMVIVNTGQLLYSHRHNKAMTMRSWSAMPRKSIMHDMIRIHGEENRVKGHHTPVEHIKSVFDELLSNSGRIAPNAEIYLVAIEGGTDYMLNVLKEDFSRYGSRITAMALINSLMDDSQIKDPTLRAFLHQRTREWRYSDLISDPQICTQLPRGYVQDAKQDPPHESGQGGTICDHMAWTEKVPEAEAGPRLSTALHHLTINNIPTESTELNTMEWFSGQGAICPTFAGGQSSMGEHVFTNERVQHAAISFFEEVAKDPELYHNPEFQGDITAPQPTADNPLILDPVNPNVVTNPLLEAQITPEQAELHMEKEKLEKMSLALAATPTANPETRQGRDKLFLRIANQKTRIAKLEDEALAHGGLRAEEATEKRENWKLQNEGPKVKFAGTMVDSELLKAAGLGDTAEEELQKLEEQ